MDRQRILVFGSEGQLGRALLRQFSSYEVTGVSRQVADVTNVSQVKSVLDSATPEIIINAAAYTKVEDAEMGAGSDAFAINALGPYLLATEASRRGIPLVHISH
jgi:dTDP-4-dehydrorhamnose reductase